MLHRKFCFWGTLAVFTAFVCVSCVSYSASVRGSAGIPIDTRLAESAEPLYLGETGVFFAASEEKFVPGLLILYYLPENDEIEISMQIEKNNLTLFLPRSGLENQAFSVLSGKTAGENPLPSTLIFESEMNKTPQTRIVNLLFIEELRKPKIRIAANIDLAETVGFFWDKKLYFTQNQLERFFFLTETETINAVFEAAFLPEQEDQSDLASFDTF